MYWFRRALAAFCVVAWGVSWHWGGARGSIIGIFTALLIAAFVALPTLQIFREARLKPLEVAVPAACAIDIAVGMLSVPQPLEDFDPDSRSVVPLAHVLGGSAATTDVEAWQTVGEVAMALAVAGAIGCYLVTRHLNKRTHGAAIDRRALHLRGRPQAPPPAPPDTVEERLSPRFDEMRAEGPPDDDSPEVRP